MDVFGITYIIENAQQFWSGECYAVPRAPRGTLTERRNRARGYCPHPQRLHPRPTRCYAAQVHHFLRVLPRCVLNFRRVRTKIDQLHAEQYLQTPLQLEHSCDILLGSELFAFHSERMCELLMDDAKSVRTPFSCGDWWLSSTKCRVRTRTASSYSTTSSLHTDVERVNSFDPTNDGGLSSRFSWTTSSYNSTSTSTMPSAARHLAGSPHQ